MLDLRTIYTIDGDEVITLLELVRRKREQMNEICEISRTSKNESISIVPYHQEPHPPDHEFTEKKIEIQVIRSIFEEWKTVLDHPRAKLDDKRKRVIRKALKLGYMRDDLIKAFHGCKKSKWHMGDNPNKVVYDDINLILRDAAHIEKFIQLDDGKEEPLSSKDFYNV